MNSTAKNNIPECSPEFKHIYRYEAKNKSVNSIAKILPGEYYVTRNNEMITTVLGSCVAVCVYDPVKKIGGMNHFMLPSNSVSSSLDSCSLNDNTRYGNYAMEKLINDLLHSGAQRNRLVFKVFGGANVMSGKFDIGKRNIEFTHSFLQNDGYRIDSEDVGMAFPRQVNFYPLTGVVKVKRLPENTLASISKEEIKTKTKMDAPPPESGELELF